MTDYTEAVEAAARGIWTRRNDHDPDSPSWEEIGDWLKFRYREPLVPIIKDITPVVRTQTLQDVLATTDDGPIPREVVVRMIEETEQ